MDTAGTLTVHCAALPRKALRNEETERKERMNMDNTDNMNVNMDMQTGAEERPEPLTGADPGTLANAIAHFLDGKKARDIRIINMKNKTDICDYMVLATGTSSTHVQTLGGEVEYQMSRSMWRDATTATGWCWTTRTCWYMCSPRTRGNFTIWKNCTQTDRSGSLSAITHGKERKQYGTARIKEQLLP